VVLHVACIITAARDGKAEYQASRIPGALFFDIDGISNPNTGEASASQPVNP
jgi:3-mercaptopyruvate sulfurtransferase SseA